MIAKSLLTFLLLAACYMLLLPYSPPAVSGLTGGSQGDKNKIREEHLLYKDHDHEVVLVGSSITATLVDLPESWYSLAMPGRSSITGLDVICESNIAPCTILIETNVLKSKRHSPDNFLNKQLKKTHSAFLTENKPAHAGLRLLAKLAGFKPGSQRVTTDLVLSKPDKITVSQKLFSRMLDRRKVFCSELMDVTELENRINQIKTSVETLEARGFQVLFIEVPECPQTLNSARKTQIRDAFHSTFPIDKYDWYDDLENINYYASNDGIHLTANSAKRFRLALIEYIAGQKQNP